MSETKNKVKPVNKLIIECEFSAKAPSGAVHCCHDHHINWKIPNGCRSDLCPIGLSIIDSIRDK